MSILVTGGTGFIGRHVVAELRRQGIGVRVMSRDPDAGSWSEVVPWDLRRREGLERVLEGMDGVIHCAAALGGDAETQRSDTVVGTRNLLEAMTVVGVKRLVGISSMAVYDYLRLPDGSALTEASPLEAEPDRRAPYIAAKLEQERLIDAHGEAGDWHWTILRPGLVFGPGRTWFHALGIRLGERRWVCLAPNGLLPVTYVENCAEAIVLALETPGERGTRLNLVDDAPPTRGQYIRALAEASRPSPAVHSVSWKTLRRSARLMDAADRGTGRRLRLPDLLDPPSLHARCKPLLYPGDRARNALGWTPRYEYPAAFARSLGAV